jgi:hypothetical protein
VFNYLFSMSTCALASDGAVNAIKVGSQTDLAGPHFCDDGANCVAVELISIQPD